MAKIMPIVSLGILLTAAVLARSIESLTADFAAPNSGSPSISAVDTKSLPHSKWGSDRGVFLCTTAKSRAILPHS
jgi:hypothetical protein